MFKQTHKWVRFYNPRNKRVSVVACAKCGIAKGDISDSVPCETLPEAQHRMQRMGWQVSPR